MIFEIFKKKEKNPEYKIKMDYDKTKPATKANIAGYLRGLGIDVRLNTKARGNRGIYLKNRIDIARGLDEKQSVSTLVHEFAHYVHGKTDKDFNKTGGSLKDIFDTDDTKIIKEELVKVTDFIDKREKMEIFFKSKQEISAEIKNMQKKIQEYYPDFKRSKKFVQFEKYIKNSDAKYLVKYDAIRLIKGWLVKKEIILSINHLETDFPDMPYPFKIYIKLCSMQRKQARISKRINKMNKYYNKPTELFARFVQGYFSDFEIISKIAPVSVKRFKQLLNEGKYKELKDFFEVFAV